MPGIPKWCGKFYFEVQTVKTHVQLYIIYAY